MKPIQKLREGGMSGPEYESAVAIFCNDVVDDRAGFREHQFAVGDHRRRPDRMQRLVLGRSQHGDGIARIALQLVGNRQLLAQPDYTLGLRLDEMMDGEHEASWKDDFGDCAGMCLS